MTKLSEFIQVMPKEEFEKLPRNERAKLVAEDVLKLVKFNRIKPQRGDYYEDGRITQQLLHKTASFDMSDDANREAFVNGCHVCAKGACFVASLLRTNNAVVDDLDDVMHCHMRDRLVPHIFTFQEFEDMEMVFEGWSPEETPIDDWRGSLRSTYGIDGIYGGKYDTALVVGVMLTILACDGEFRPDALVPTSDVVDWMDKNLK